MLASDSAGQSQQSTQNGWSRIDIVGDSHHNLILRNRIDFVGSYARDGDDFGDSISISISIDTPANHNPVASNYFAHGGHDLLRTKGSSNIVQDNALRGPVEGAARSYKSRRPSK